MPRKQFTSFLLGFILTFAFGALDLMHADAAPITAYCSSWGSVQSALLFNDTHPEQSAAYHNGFDFGEPQRGGVIGDVTLPAWAKGSPIGIDNVHIIPEPTTCGLLVAGALLSLRRRRR